MKRILSVALVGALWAGSAIASEQSAPVLTRRGPGLVTFSPGRGSVEVRETSGGRRLVWRYTQGVTGAPLRWSGHYCPRLRQFVTLTKTKLAFGLLDKGGKPWQSYSLGRVCLDSGRLCRLHKTL
jgi:hypothetical protein